MKFGVFVFPGSNRDHDAWHTINANLAPFAADVHAENMSGTTRPTLRARFSPVMTVIKKFAADGGPVFGICNGFQILVESGLLPGALIRNRRLRFICKQVGLETATSDSPFTWQLRKGQIIHVPIAHGEGQYFADPATLDELEAEDRVAFRYVDNPNGSARDIAGILSRERNVLGMMPHPEDACEPLMGSTDGLGIFQSLLASLDVAR